MVGGSASSVGANDRYVQQNAFLIKKVEQSLSYPQMINQSRIDHKKLRIFLRKSALLKNCAG
jgi:hypothetical protein